MNCESFSLISNFSLKNTNTVDPDICYIACTESLVHHNNYNSIQRNKVVNFSALEFVAVDVYQNQSWLFYH